MRVALATHAAQMRAPSMSCIHRANPHVPAKRGQQFCLKTGFINYARSKLFILRPQLVQSARIGYACCVRCAAPMLYQETPEAGRFGPSCNRFGLLLQPAKLAMLGLTGHRVNKCSKKRGQQLAEADRRMQRGRACLCGQAQQGRQSLAPGGNRCQRRQRSARYGTNRRVPKASPAAHRAAAKGCTESGSAACMRV